MILAQLERNVVTAMGRYHTGKISWRGVHESGGTQRSTIMYVPVLHLLMKFEGFLCKHANKLESLLESERLRMLASKMMMSG